ncbi:MAG TPA: phage tail tape measure protein [Chloroflexota bacterium]|nr:phage tail tape measure protein [Chloroflexota bacterium]
MADLNVAVLIAGKDQLSGPAGNAAKSLNGLERAAKDSTGAFGSLTNAIQQGIGIAAGLSIFSTASNALKGAASSAINFEKSMSGISAVSGATGAQMKELSGLALDLGKQTSFSAGQAAAGIEELIKGGVSIGDVFGGAASAALNLAAAGEIGVGDAAEIAANAMNNFGLKGADMAKVSDLIAGAANASSLSVNDFKFSLAAVGSVANLSGQSFDSTAVAIAQLGAAGIKGSDAGTSLKAVLANLIPTTKPATAAMRELGIITADGANQFIDSTGKIKDFGSISEILQTQTAGLTDAQRLLKLEMIFGSDGMRAAGILAKEGGEGFTAMAAEMGKVTAESVALERLNNVAGDLEQLKGSAETAGIILLSSFSPAIRAATQGVTEFVNSFIDVSRLVVGVFESLTGPAAGVEEAMGRLAYAIGEDAANAVMTLLRAFQGDLGPALEWVRDRVGEIQAKFVEFAPSGERIGALFSWVADRVAQDLLPMLGQGENALRVLGETANASEAPMRGLAEYVNGLTEAIQNGLQFLRDHKEVQDAISAIVSGLIGRYALMNGAIALNAGFTAAAAAGQSLWNAAIIAGDLARFIQMVIALNVQYGLAAAASALAAVRTGAHTVAMGAWAGATGIATAAQIGFNVAMAANPIALVVVALAGLVAALVVAYKTNETFRNIVNGAWESFKTTVGPAIQGAWDKIVAFSNWLKAAPGEFIAAAQSIGKAIIDGIGNGIAAGAGGLRAKAAEMATGALNAAKAALGIASPSKAFEEIGAFVAEGFALGISENLSPVEQAAAEMAQKVEDAEREHQIRIGRMWEDAGSKKGDARKAALERIERAEEDHVRKVEGINEGGAARIVQLERDQSKRRGDALVSFLGDMDKLESDVTAKASSIGEKLGDTLLAAASDAQRAIGDVVSRAGEQWQSAAENLGLSRVLRGRRDEFSSGQSGEAKRFKERRDDSEAEHRWLQDKAKAQEKYTAGLAALTAKQKVNATEAELAKTQQQREQLGTRLAEETQNADKSWEASKKETIRRRGLEEEERTFKQSQDTARRAFDDGLENEALAKTQSRLVTERDSRVSEIGAALEAKQRKLEAQAVAERDLLIRSYEERVTDLRDKFLGKLGPLTETAQATLLTFLDRIAARTAEVAGELARVASSSASALTGVADSGSGFQSGLSLSSFASDAAPSLATQTFDAPSFDAPSSDNQTFGNQSNDVQELFQATWGDQAAAQWEAERALTVNVNVEGSVQSEQDLTRSIYNGLRELERSGLRFGGSI